MTEQNWFGCVIPEDLLYDLERDVWIRRLDSGEVECGMTDVAQTRCGRFVGVSWKHPGKQVKQGRPMAVIESAKWVGPFPRPVSGQITADNRLGFEADVAVANRDPYGAGLAHPPPARQLRRRERPSRRRRHRLRALPQDHRGRRDSMFPL